MEYSYKKPRIAIKFQSAYIAKPLTFTFRRKEALSPKTLTRIEKEIEFLEKWAASEEDTLTRAFRAEYKLKASRTISRIIHGYRRAKCFLRVQTKVATRLNEKRENDYVLTRQELVPIAKWVKE